MSMFENEAERNKFLLNQASIILSGLLGAEENIYYAHAQKLLGGSMIDAAEKSSIAELHAAIFRDLKEQFRNA